MNDEELLRYSRQLMLQGFDVAGQEALLASTVLIVGLGGLGSPVAMYLAAAGVGKLILADSDVVDMSNLQRQIIHKSRNIGMNKTLSAQQSIQELNAAVQVELIQTRLSGEQLQQAVAASSAVVDCTDNFSTRFALNEVCWKQKVPLISAAAIRMEAQLSVFDARNSSSPCYNCLYSEGSDADLSCAENGVMSPLVGMIGSMQALECIKVLSGYGTPLVGKLLLVDAASMQIRTMALQKNPECLICRD